MMAAADGSSDDDRATSAAARCRRRRDPLERAPEALARRNVDVVSFVAGVLLTVAGGLVLWAMFGGSLEWHQLQSVLPLVLVVAGICGLVLLPRRP